MPGTTGRQGHSGSRTAKGERIHVVVAGESLWSIAREQLGGDASNAQIAGEVHRLWELNANVVATGDPDLLPVGTRLKMP